MARGTPRAGSLVETVRSRAADSAFGRPVVQNNFRALIAEAIVDLALPQGWRWCSGDWAAWDFEHDDGTRLEVKQSAARQTWTAPATPSPPRFDIAHRQGRWEGAVWIEEARRHAQLYVFAHHPVLDESADHRNPLQWRFYVVPTSMLPAARSISLRPLESLCGACGFDELGSQVENARLAIGLA